MVRVFANCMYFYELKKIYENKESNTGRCERDLQDL